MNCTENYGQVTGAIKPLAHVTSGCSAHTHPVLFHASHFPNQLEVLGLLFPGLAYLYAENTRAILETQSQRQEGEAAIVDAVL